MDNEVGGEPELDIENIYFTLDDEFVPDETINPMTITEEQTQPCNESGKNTPLLSANENEKDHPPPIVFIVPYRNREAHLAFFRPHMAKLLENVDFKYKILFLHQKDDRSFNRGAMKNIGLLVVKEMYPDTYQHITLVFHDIDNLLTTLDEVHNFATTPGKIRHFYGYTHTLGGIFSITAGDFERINGFPNFWTWGYEDNAIQHRAMKAGIEIDRSVFYLTSAGLDKILRLYQPSVRDVNSKEYDRYLNQTTEGIDSIADVEYSYSETTGFVDVTYFTTGVEESVEHTKEHNLEYGARPFNVDSKLVIKANFRNISKTQITEPIRIVPKPPKTTTISTFSIGARSRKPGSMSMMF